MGLMDRDYMHKRWQEAENAPPMMPPRLDETIFRENRKMDEPAQPKRNWIRSPKIPAFRWAVILWVMSFAAYIYMANQRAMALPKELAKYALTPREHLILLSERFASWIGETLMGAKVSSFAAYQMYLFAPWLVLLSVVLTAVGLASFQMAARWFFVEFSLLFYVFVAIHSTPIVSTGEVVAILVNAVMTGAVFTQMYSGAVDLKFRGYAVS